MSAAQPDSAAEEIMEAAEDPAAAAEMMQAAAADPAKAAEMIKAAAEFVGAGGTGDLGPVVPAEETPCPTTIGPAKDAFYAVMGRPVNMVEQGFVNELTHATVLALIS